MNILPGQTAPFDVSAFSNNTQAAYMDHVKFHLNWIDTHHNAGLNGNSSATRMVVYAIDIDAP